MQLLVDKCKDCGYKSSIVNKKYHLCQKCNWKRLHPDEKPKTYELKRTAINNRPSKPIKRSSKPIRQRSEKSRGVLERDEQTYKKVFQSHTDNNWGRCSCEECGQELLDYFQDEKGKIVQRWRYSHILTKAAYPEFRHKVENFNILCLRCHGQWETGDRKSMKIYGPNQIIISLLLNK